jgi:Flp pilus assembly protein TadG
MLTRTGWRATAALTHCTSGVAALEFALIAPAMVVMFLGMTEVTAGINTNRKLVLVSRTLADLTGRFTRIASSDVSNVFAAARTVMQPYSSDAARMVVSSVVVTTSGSTSTGTVAWSCATGTGASPRTANSTYPVPASFTSATSFILVETKLTYVPMFGGQFTGGAIEMNETIPWPVRNAPQVSWSGAAC